jgi:hypothetical protein
MKNPTIVTTSVMTRERASREKEIACEYPSNCIHVQSVRVKAAPWGGAPTNSIASMTARSADIPTDPTPTKATTFFDSRRPSNARTRKPATGRVGIK